MRDNWKRNSLGEYVKLQGGFAFSSNSFRESGIPLVRISNITNSGISNEFAYLPLGFLNAHSEFSLNEGDIVIAMSGATTGKNCQITSKHLPALLNQRAGRFVVNKKDELSNEFLAYVVKSQEFQNELLIDAVGGAQPNISSKQIENLSINLPPLPQQRKIAKILSTCDTVIAKTEEAIAKYQAIKQGMMHDLFTRGIDLSTGKLRPKYQDAPELYKESEMGMIPKDWEVKRLGEFGEFKNGLNKDKDSYGHGTPFVNIIDAYPEKLDVSRLGLVDTNSIEREIYKLIEGDIIFVRSSVKPEGVGYNTIYESSKDQIVYCGFMIRFRIENKEKFTPSFFNLYFRSQKFRRSLLAVSTVSANTNINQDNLSKLFSIYPQKSEQLKAIEKIENINKKIAVERASLAKYHQIKSGLMQDLLSGKVEVSVSKEEEIVNA